MSDKDIGANKDANVNEMEAAATSWIEEVTGKKLPGPTFHESLKA